jgi:tetratricopeptide (TPR) repeat protein
MRRSDYAAAVRHYSRVLLLDPAHAVAYANRAQAHLNLRDFTAAAADATDALRRDPTHVKSWVRRAAARTALGVHGGAAADLRAAAALAPADKTVLAELRKAEETVRSCAKRLPEVTLPVRLAGEAVGEGGAQEADGRGE